MSQLGHRLPWNRTVPGRIDRAGFIDFAGVHLIPALFRLAAHKGGTAHIGDALHWLTARNAVCHFNQCTLCVAVEQDVALAVHHDGATHLVAPVVVVRNTAQRTFDAAQHDRHIVVGLAAALAVDNGGAVGALAAHIARGVSIVGADFAIGRIAVDHGVHIARRHAPEQIGFAQHLEGLGTLPVRLGDDAHAKALGLQHAANHCHAKAGVVHIGITRDQNHVTAVPTELVHLRTAHRQKWRRTKALGPVRAVARQRLGVARKKGNINGCVHRKMLVLRQQWKINPPVYFRASNIGGCRCIDAVSRPAHPHALQQKFSLCYCLLP